MSRRDDRRVPREPAGAAAPDIPATVRAAVAHADGKAIMAGLHRQSEGTMYDIKGPLTGVLAAWEEQIIAGLGDGTVTGCGHLRSGDAQPMIWLAWEPGRLLCRPCAAGCAEAINGTPADDICDGCGVTSPTLALVAGDVPGGMYGQVAIGPVIMQGGLCPACEAANERPAGGAVRSSRVRAGPRPVPPAVRRRRLP